MSDVRFRPTSCEFLVDLLTGEASASFSGATVQRSHRFPLSIFIQLENMAQMAGVPVSLIINQVLECGLETVRQELPEDVVQELQTVKPEQLNRPTVTERVEGKSRKAAEKAKPKLSRAK